MAQNFFQDENEENEQNMPVQSGQSVNITAGSNTQAPNPPQQRKTAGSGRFQNLQKFITANQQAGQESRQKLESQFQQKVDPTTQKIQTGLQTGLQTAQTEKQRLSNTQPLFQTTIADARKLDQQQQNRFKNLLTGQAQQVGLQDKETIQQGVQGAEQYAQQSAEQLGRRELLRGLAPKQKYTEGLLSLDALLFESQQPEVQKLVQTTGEGASALGKSFQDTITQLGAENEAVQGLAGQAKTGAQTALTQGLEKIKTDVGTRQQKFNSNVTQLSNILNNTFAGKSVSAEEDAFLKTVAPELRNQLMELTSQKSIVLSPEQQQQLKGKLTAQLIDDAARFASNEELMDEIALQKLGLDKSYLSGFNDVVGTAPTDLSGQTTAKSYIDQALELSNQLRSQKQQEAIPLMQQEMAKYTADQLGFAEGGYNQRGAPIVNQMIQEGRTQMTPQEVEAITGLSNDVIKTAVFTAPDGTAMIKPSAIRMVDNVQNLKNQFAQQLQPQTIRPGSSYVDPMTGQTVRNNGTKHITIMGTEQERQQLAQQQQAQLNQFVAQMTQQIAAEPAQPLGPFYQQSGLTGALDTLTAPMRYEQALTNAQNAISSKYNHNPYQYTVNGQAQILPSFQNFTR